MSKQSRLFAMRWAVSGLVLAAAFEGLANPVLTADGEALLSAAQSGDPLPDIVPRSDRRLMESDPLTPQAPAAIDEIRFDDAVPGRRPRVDEAAASTPWATPGLSVDYGNAFGQGGAAESGPGGSHPLNPAQAMLRETVQNALKLVRDSTFDESDMVNFSIVGVDFNLALGGGRRSLTVNGTDVWPTILHDPLHEEVRQGPSAMASAGMHGQGVRSAGGSGDSAQPWASAQSSVNPLETRWGAGSTDLVSLVVTRVREFVTDPLAIVVAFGCLFLWVAYEIAIAVRERRRRWRERRYHRRHARARTTT